SASRLAVTVPPTPPPTMTTSSTVPPPPSSAAGPAALRPRLSRGSSADLLHHEAGDVPVLLHCQQPVPRLLHPLGDVGLGAPVAGQNRHHLPLLRRLEGPDEFHQGTRAGAAPSVDFPVHHVLGHVRPPPPDQMNRVIA